MTADNITRAILMALTAGNIYLLFQDPTTAGRIIQTINVIVFSLGIYYTNTKIRQNERD